MGLYDTIGIQRLKPLISYRFSLQLETFKRTLMQSLQEDDDNPKVCIMPTLLPSTFFEYNERR